MVTAFVMIDVAAGAADEALATIRDVDAVREAHIVAGDFDIIAEVEGAEAKDILKTVTREIRPVDFVGTTKSYICLG